MRKKNNLTYLFFGFFTLLSLIASCSEIEDKDKHIKKADTPTEGTIYISVDESFKPVIEEQIKMYEVDNPATKIIASYKSEGECLQDLQKDSTRLVIISRTLTDAEFDAYKNKLSYYPYRALLAWDGISVIVNKKSNDTLLTIKDLNTLANATFKQPQKIVVDGLTSTSIVIYLMDSIAKSNKIGVNVQGVRGSKAVLDFVANNTDAIGLVGSSWVGNIEDPEQVKYFDKIKTVLIKAERDSLGRYVKPSPATISTDLYPFIRPIYCIVKENTPQLGSGFMNFMMTERGQLIFRRANVVPGVMYFGTRLVTVNKEK